MWENSIPTVFGTQYWRCLARYWKATVRKIANIVRLATTAYAVTLICPIPSHLNWIKLTSEIKKKFLGQRCPIRSERIEQKGEFFYLKYRIPRTLIPSNRRAFYHPKIYSDIWIFPIQNSPQLYDLETSIIKERQTFQRFHESIYYVYIYIYSYIYTNIFPCVFKSPRPYILGDHKTVYVTWHKKSMHILKLFFLFQQS